MPHHLLYAVNCSMLFTELPLLERADAARHSGFDAVEFWWPWPDQPVPGDREVDAFVTSIVDAGVQLVGLNFFAGDLAGPDCGVLSLPGRSAEFRDNIAVTLGIGQQLGVGAFNALYGNRSDDVRPEEQDELALENLTLAAAGAAAIGSMVLLEPVSGPKRYPLRTAADVLAVIDRVPESSVGFLCDLYHLASNGEDLDAVVDRYGDRIAHVQIADAPGRGEPGSGSLDIDRLLGRIEGIGYGGFVALEYTPTGGNTIDSLEWLPQRRRGMSGDVREAL